MNRNSQDKTIAVILLHAGCDMDCLFCVTDERLQTMTLPQYRTLLGHLKQQGFQNIVLGGGEPFCWPYHLENAARTGKEHGFLVQVGTNGIAMPDDAAYPEYVDRYVLPLDASEAGLHNRLRCMRPPSADHFSVILQRMEQLRRHHRSVTASTVISRDNLEDLVAIGNKLADYVAEGGRLHAWHLYRFIPDGRGGRLNADRLNITEMEYNEAVQQAREQSYPFTIFKRPNMRHSATVDFFWYEEGLLQVGSDYWEEEIVREQNLCRKK